ACIGATTQDEYRRHIESDPALERRFQPVQVLEPSPAEARTMLEGLRLGLERHHGVTIQPDALDAAVALTVRYVPMRRLPDKAIEVLDEACTRAVIPGLTSTPPLSADLFDGSQPLVTEDTVSEVVAAWTGIPVGRLGPAEADRLADLEAHLAARVVGQPAAIQRVAQRVRLARAGLTAPERPAGVFLFLGPSGVGKTELAHALAEATLGGATRLIRLDMSEYAEQHATARLIGAPPGYQGYGDEGQLSGPLRRTPHAVVLLDEVEKAHPDIFDLFLQLFDAGRLTDGSGRPVDGRQAIFVLTSNLVVSAPGRRALGFGGASGSGGDSSDGDDREALLSDLRQFFRPELLNRIDEIVLFRALGEADLREIMRRRLHELQQRLVEQHGIHLNVSEATLALLTRRAVAGSGGAREVQRLINRLIQEPLSRNLLAGRYRPGERLSVDASADGVTLVSDAG
ncbi:MAG: AAA family ATPase, partial [Chloroflexota bacterium]